MAALAPVGRALNFSLMLSESESLFEAIVSAAVEFFSVLRDGQSKASVCHNVCQQAQTYLSIAMLSHLPLWSV